jgi:integrase
MGIRTLYTGILDVHSYEATTMTIRELLLERYAPLHALSARSVVLFSSSIDRLRDHLEREPELADFTDLTMAKFIRWRSTTPHRGRLPSPATVAKDKAHLSSLANHAARKKLIPEFVEWPRLRVPTRPPRGYTVEEISAIVRAGRNRCGVIGGVPAPWFWMTLPWAAWETGERIGSLLRVRWGEVDLDRRVVTFLGEHRKDHITTIQRAIGPQLATVLATQRREDSRLVFPWLDDRKEATIFQSLQTQCRRAGVTPRGFHAFRKASASYVQAAGGNASEHLGHADPKTTRDHYLDTRITGQQSALDYLPPLDLRFGDPAGGSASGG